MRPGATANKLSSTNANVRKHKRKCAKAQTQMCEGATPLEHVVEYYTRIDFLQ